jgi:hypothetical protein
MRQKERIANGMNGTERGRERREERERERERGEREREEINAVTLCNAATCYLLFPSTLGCVPRKTFVRLSYAFVYAKWYAS